TSSTAAARVATTQAAQPPHAEFLGLPFSLLSQAEVIRVILARGDAPYRYIVTPNAYHVVAAHEDPARLLPIYRDAWLSLCDSRIIRASAGFERRALHLVTGSDLVAALFATLNAPDRLDRRQRLLIVGSSPDAEPALRAAYPEVTFDILPAPDGLARSAELRLA